MENKFKKAALLLMLASTLFLSSCRSSKTGKMGRAGAVEEEIVQAEA